MLSCRYIAVWTNLSRFLAVTSLFGGIFHAFLPPRRCFDVSLAKEGADGLKARGRAAKYGAA